MNRTLVIVVCWFLLCIPAAGLVGGVPAADPTLARHAVALFGSHSMCTGIVLTQNLVLTAAHCAADPHDRKVIGFPKPHPLADVTEAAVHPQFERKGQAAVADLALLKLSKPLPLDFAPVRLNTQPIAEGERLIVLGYGQGTKTDNKIARSPRMALLKVSRQSNMLLLLTDPGYDKSGGCHGDSGGPAFTIHASVPALAGVMASGDCSGVTVAVSLTAYLDWIKETAHQLGSEMEP
jgi:hypothetical protein